MSKSNTADDNSVVSIEVAMFESSFDESKATRRKYGTNEVAIKCKASVNAIAF